MTATLATSLTLLQPHLASELVTPETVEFLLQAARWLPPIPRAGFECRLQADAAQVDLHQNIRADNDEPAVVAGHLTRLLAANPTVLHPAWQGVLRFCEMWADPESLLHDGIEELWLELDMQNTQTILAAPSVFIGARTTVEASMVQGSIFNSALDLLSGERLPDLVQRNLARCFDALPEDAKVSHIGYMPSRLSGIVRINVKGLQSNQLDEYLKNIGWPDGFEEVVAASKETIDRVGDVTLCFDVAATVLPYLGVECFFGSDPDTSRWYSWMDYLVESGLCSEKKRGALLAWQGRTTPVSTEREWPAQLIVDSLLQPVSRFSAFERLQHHTKVTHGPGGQKNAKGYFGFAHQWLEPFHLALAK